MIDDVKGTEMDIFADLLPSAHTVKAESTAKDRKQKPKQLRKIEKLYRENIDVVEEKVGVASSNWEHDERRAGKERRSRWTPHHRKIDTREPKDRRQQSQALFVKI